MADTGDTGVTQKVQAGGGNTNRHQLRARSWCFTVNNHTEGDVTQLTHYFRDANKYAMQEEEGDNGTPHLQGVVSFKSARSFDKLKELCPKAHWEQCRDLKRSIAYCTKADTRKGQQWTHGVPRPLDPPIQKLREWQKYLVDELAQEPGDRKIIWYVDEKGGQGKTCLCKKLCIENGDCIYVNGKANDMKFAIAQRVEAGNPPRICLLDFTRCTEGRISYEGLESIKNGIFFSGKYESGMVIYNSPHVVCFANFWPERSQLTEDRWDIRPMEQEYELIEA